MVFRNFRLLNPGNYLNVLLAFIIVNCTSCIGSKPVPYFSGGTIDTSQENNLNIPDQVIQKGDMLSISIYSDNAEATAIFNQAGGMGGGVGPPPIIRTVGDKNFPPGLNRARGVQPSGTRSGVCNETGVRFDPFPRSVS